MGAHRGWTFSSRPVPHPRYHHTAQVSGEMTEPVRIPCSLPHTHTPRAPGPLARPARATPSTLARLPYTRLTSLSRVEPQPRRPDPLARSPARPHADLHTAARQARLLAVRGRPRLRRRDVSLRRPAERAQEKPVPPAGCSHVGWGLRGLRRRGAGVKAQRAFALGSEASNEISTLSSFALVNLRNKILRMQFRRITVMVAGWTWCGLSGDLWR